MEKEQNTNFFYRFYQSLLHVDGDFIESYRLPLVSGSEKNDNTSLSLQEKIYTVLFVACAAAFFIGLWFAFALAGGIGVLIYLVLIAGVAEGLYEAYILLF